jgi:hypothetical protein
LAVAIRIFDARGELVSEMAGTVNAASVGSLFNLETGSFAPDPSGVGGLLPIYFNDSWIASWNARDTGGNLVPGGVYHLVVEFQDSNGTKTTIAKNVVLDTPRTFPSVSFDVRPNVVRNGERVEITVRFNGAPANGRSIVKIFDLAGELVWKLGLHDGLVTWSPDRLAPGLYLLVLEGEDPGSGLRVKRTRKIILAR